MAKDLKGKELPKGIRQRSNGKYQVRVMFEGVSHTANASTLTEAKKIQRELTYKLEHGEFVSEKKITFGEWFNTWMDQYKKNRVKAGTFYNYKKYYQCILKDRFGNKQISGIRGEHIQKLYNELVEEGYALSTIKIVSAVLNGSMSQAYKNGLIERNPVKLADLPRQTEKHERVAMTREQQQLFMKYAESSYLYNLFAVMLRTGMRAGEIRGLRYSDMDKKKNVLHIERTLKYIEGIGYFDDTPKTKTSRRDIPLTTDIIHFMDEQKRYWGFKVEKMDRYLFCNENGEPLSRERLQGEINRIRRRIEADGHDFPYITPHCFRHTFATRAIESGMTPQVLKTILGHSSLAMTMDLYSHVLEDTRQEAMQSIAAAF